MAARAGASLKEAPRLHPVTAMEQQHGPWKIKAHEHRYKDAFLELWVDTVDKPNGDPDTYATVQLKRGVAILPIDKDGKVYLTRQFRYAIGQESIEVISGGAEEGEEPLVAAKREVREELGIEGKNWQELGFFHLETSMIKGPVYLFVVRDLSFTETDPDDTEDIKRIKVSLEEAVEKVLQNEITQGPSCVLILKTYLLQQRSQKTGMGI